jgi:hypothetical protein
MRAYYHESHRIAAPRGDFAHNPLSFDFVMCHKQIDLSKSVVIRLIQAPSFFYQLELK